jgi:diguanylate cyclase (GGDEF)-like protein
VSEDDGVLFADVEHNDNHFGRLAACFPRGSSFADSERRLLRAYARHAGAVLAHVASLEQAANDRDTARALLELARSIAGASTVVEVARRLVDTVPRVVDCDVSALWTWDEATDELVVSAYGDHVEQTGYVGAHRVSAAALAPLHSLLHSSTPLVFDASTATSPISDMLQAGRLQQLAVVPVASQGALAGLVCAGYRRELPDEQLLFARLAGLADHAAVALQSVRLVEHIRHQALHDNLTGLANRQKLQEHGEQVLTRARRSHANVAMLFIDLDRFKYVNDTLGHAAGDDLIRQAAERVAETVPAGEVLARLGGDEFLLLLAGDGSADAARAVAERIVAALRQPFTLNERQQVYISCSVGIACYPEHGNDYFTLVKHADAAMYLAKAQGRNSIAIYTERRTTPRPTSLELEGQLRAALDNDEVEVLFQPQYDLRRGVVGGAEALARWMHPTYGMLEPKSFLKVAEDSGLIIAIDEYVRRRSFTAARMWADQGHLVRVAVNLTARDVNNVRFADKVADEARAHGLAPELVELEITDRITLDDDSLRRVVDAFHGHGFRLAIDDFGTGNSVLGRLHRYRIDTLKIDRSFIADIHETTDEGVVVEAVLALARSLGMTTVVEGVENVHQLNAAQRYGADLAQGFLLSRPVDAATMLELLSTTSSVTQSLLRPAKPDRGGRRPRKAAGR